jgi:hypothetical protein
MPQPVPAVPQAPAGWHPVQADLDLWITDSFSFLSQPANFRAQLQGVQSLAGGAFNVLHYDTVLEDPYTGWSAVATGSQPAYSWLCPAGCAGWYEASVTVQTASQGAGTANQLLGAIALNGTLWQYASDDWAAASAPSGSSGPAQVPMLPGDYLQVWAFTTQNVSTPATAGQYPALELTWVSS